MNNCICSAEILAVPQTSSQFPNGYGFEILKIAWHGLSLTGTFEQTFPTKLVS